MKTKILNKGENIVDSYKNFLNNQNYIINKKFFLLKYISNIDKEEKTKSKVLVYLILFSILLIFISTFLLIEVSTPKNFIFYAYWLIWLAILMILTYILYVIKHIFFYKKRIKKFNVIKDSLINYRVKIIKK